MTEAAIARDNNEQALSYVALDLQHDPINFRISAQSFTKQAAGSDDFDLVHLSGAEFANRFSQAIKHVSSECEPALTRVSHASAGSAARRLGWDTSAPQFTRQARTRSEGPLCAGACSSELGVWWLGGRLRVRECYMQYFCT
jgi:hypothetical protein